MLAQLPLVSLCIPTYNRAPYLKALLQSIVAYLPANECRLEILVADNAGSDDTPAVIDAFRAQLPMLKYYRNPENVGTELNMLGLVERSKGRYIWLFGDDDVFRPNGIEAVLDSLADDPDYVILNYGPIARDGTPKAIERFFDIRENRNLKQRDEVMAMFGLKLGLINSVVFRRNVFSEVPREDYLRHLASGLSYLYVSLSVAAREGLGKVLAEPVFSYRSDNSPWTAERWAGVYGHDLSLLLDEMITKGYSRSAVRKFRTTVVWDYYARVILGNRIIGMPTAVYFKSLMRNYADIPAAWLVLLTVFVPGWAARAIRYAWRKTR